MENITTPEQLNKLTLAQQLAEVLADTVTLHYLAHGYHWNVKGPHFAQFHDFFGAIYADYAGSEDRVAESIRKLGFDAPHMLHELATSTSIQARPSAGDPLEMSANLYEGVMQMHHCLTAAFDIANALNEQGIANFLAERIEENQKWVWQLGTTVGADATMIQTMPVGKSEAEVLLTVVDNDNDESLPELQPTPESFFLKASGGAGASAEVLDPRKIRKALNAGGHLVPEEADLAQALLDIVKEHGKFNDDNTGVWAGYTSAADNAEIAKIGVKCGNCVFFNSPNGCAIIEATVEEGGLCRFAVLPDGSVTPEKATEEMSTFSANEIEAVSLLAPSDDELVKPNMNGIIASARSISFSGTAETALSEKADQHNSSVVDDVRKVSLSQLKAIYRRGATEFSSNPVKGLTYNSSGIERVDNFLHLVKSGKAKVTSTADDSDLLNKEHPASTLSVGSAITASGFADRELIVDLKEESMYDGPEQAIVAMAEYSGLGYESVPVFRAAWKRAVKENESPFNRAALLAIKLYDSKDADLLPKKKEEF